MLFKGVIIGPASGKIAGAIASHNRGGQYFKGLTIPTDPNTTRQQEFRNAASSAATAWAALSADQRQQWQAWADAHPRPNALGDKHSHSGWNEFCRWAIPRVYANVELGGGLTVSGGTPSGDEAKLVTLPGANFPASTQFQITFDNTEAWCLDSSSALLVYLCTTRTAPGVRGIHTQRPTINWFRGPYQLAGAAFGNEEDPPPGFVTIDLPAAALTGERMFWRAVLTTGNNGQSQSYTGVTIYTP